MLFLSVSSARNRRVTIEQLNASSGARGNSRRNKHDIFVDDRVPSSMRSRLTTRNHPVDVIATVRCQIQNVIKRARERERGIQKKDREREREIKRQGEREREREKERGREQYKSPRSTSSEH